MEDYKLIEIKELKDFDSVSHVILRERERIDELEKRVNFLSDILIKKLGNEEILKALSKNISINLDGKEIYRCWENEFITETKLLRKDK